MTTRKPTQRYFRALALEPRILLDAAAVSTAAEVAAQVDAPTATNAPEVSATPVNGSLTLSDSSGSFPPVDLFENVQVSLDTEGGAHGLTDLVITVDRSGGNQALVIDGKTIELVAGSGTTRNNEGYFYTVSVSGTTTTITLSLASFEHAPQSVITLIDNLSYQALDNSVASGQVSVTLTRLSDESGHSVDLSALKATVDIDNPVNVPPVLSGDTLQEAESFETEALASASEVAYSANGKYAYVAGSNGTLNVFAVDAVSGRLTPHQTLEVANLGSVNALVVSSDGKSAYTVSSNGNLMQYGVGSDGKLSHIATISLGQDNYGIGSQGGMTISGDGKSVYVDTSSNFSSDVRLYSRDTTTGTLEHIQTLDQSRNANIAVSDHYVYILHTSPNAFENHYLKVYQRSESGHLSFLGSTRDLDRTGAPAVRYALATSQDGKLLYVGDPERNNITVYRLNNDTSLSRAYTIDSAPVGSLQFNTAGSVLYTVTSSGTVNLYAVSQDGNLTLKGSIAGSTSGRDLALAPDGTSILVVGNGLTRYTALQTLLPGEPIPFASGLTLADANFDVRGDYTGGKLFIQRAGNASPDDVFAFAEGQGLRLDNGQIYKGQQVIATFTVEAGTLSIAFLAGTSRDDANAILRQVTYNNTNHDAMGSLVTLTVRANDGLADSNLIDLNVLITTNTPPVVDATPVAPERYDTPGTQTSLFKDAVVDTGSAGQRLIELTFTIKGLERSAGEFLVVNGVRIDLSQTATTQAGGLDYHYRLDGSTGTLRIASASGLSTAEARNLINSAAYLNETGEIASGNRTITLASVRDNGGTAGGGVDTSEPGLQASIALAINSAPKWQADPSHLDPTLYYTNGKLSSYPHNVTDIVLSADGKLLMVSGSAGNNATGASSLYVYTRDTRTGALTLLQAYTQGESDDPATDIIEVNGLNGITAMAMHGNTLYVAGYGAGQSTATYSLHAFSYDTASGAMHYDGVVATQGVDGVTGLDAPISEIVISADGKSLYTINGVNAIDNATGKSGLAQFARDPASGALTYLGTYQGGSAELGLNGPSGIAVSADGKSVYVTNNASSMLSVFARDPASGALSYVTRITNASISADPASGPRTDDSYLQYLQDIVISPDDAYVYIGSGEKSALSIFQRNASDGSLTYVGSLNLHREGLTAANMMSIRELALSADGSALYVGLNGASELLAFKRDSSSGALTFAARIPVGGNLTTQIAVSPDGLNIYSGRSQFFNGLGVATALHHAQYSATAASTPFAQGLTFSDADFDTQGSYQGMILSIVRGNTASADDRFAFKDDAGLRLVDGQIMQGNTAIAEFTAEGGKLTIRFIAEVSKATANQVLQQVTYRNDNAEPPTRVDLKLRVDDGGKASDLTLALLLSPPELNVAASGQTSSVTIGGGSLPGPVDLFKQVSVKLGGGKPITELVLTVDRNGADQALVIDGTTIALQAGSGQTGTSGYQYEITINDNGVTQLRLHLGGATAESVAPLLEGIAYQVLADTASAGTVTVTLASLSDASTQIEPGISAVITLHDQRQLPTLGAEPGSLSYGEFSFVLEDSASQYGGIKSITIEGNTIYALSTTSRQVELAPYHWENVKTTTLFVFERNADGKLVLRDSIAATEANGLDGALSLGLSNDGQLLHAMTNEGVALFSRNTSTGTLNTLGTLTSSSVTFIRDVQAQAGALYVSTGDSLKVYQRDGSNWVERDSETPFASDAQFSAMQVSPDGKFLFAGLTGADALVGVFSIGTDGALTWVEDAGSNSSTNIHNASTLTISPDGKSLYISETVTQEGSSEDQTEQSDKGRLHILSIATDGRLTTTQVLELDSPPRTIVSSPDSSVIALLRDLQLSSVVELYQRASNGSLALLTSVATLGDDPDAAGTADTPAYIALRDVRTLTFSVDGSQLYLPMEINWQGQEYSYYSADGILIVDLKPITVTFTERGGPVALLPGATLSDPQLDAAGNYQGASLEIERQGGPQAGDAFAFLAGNGLELKDGKIWKGTSAIAEFVESNSKLTITFLAGVSQADAQHVARQLAYTSSSNDPTRNGDTARFQLVFNDGDGNSATLETSIDLVGMNDAAVATTTPLTPTVTSAGDPVALFKDTQIDTIEFGQNIQRVVLTIGGVTAGDMLGVDGGKIPVDKTVDWMAHVGDSRIEYRVRVSEGVATVTLYVVRPGTAAAAVIDSLTYSHTGSESSGTRTFNLELLEEVNSKQPQPHNASTTIEGQATVTLRIGAGNEPIPPTATATGHDSQIRIGSGGVLPGDVDLFSGVSVSAGLEGSEIERLVITVDHTGGSQALVIGGTQIALTAGNGVGNGYLYEVTVAGDTTTLSLTLTGQSNAEVGTLIDGIAYRVLDSSAARGEVSVTLSEIRNSDGIEAEPGISAKVTLVSNTAPTATPGDFTLDAAKAGQNYSSQLPANLFSDADGDTLSWTVEGLPSGLSFDPVSRTLSGTVQAMGSHELTLKVSDGWGGEAEIKLTFDVVNSEPVANGQFSLSQATPGQAYNVALPENLFSDANDSDLTWEITELPEWLSFDAATRTLSGTAPDTTGSYSITIKASDAHGGSATLTLALRVASAEPTTRETVLPELNTGFQQSPGNSSATRFDGPALNAPLFQSNDAPNENPVETTTAVQPAAATPGLLRNSGSGLADGRGSLREQLANADGVLTDSGQQNARNGFSFDGTTLRSNVDLTQGESRSISLQLPVELPDGSSAQRVTLANGLPLPSWASFDARTGELRIDRERLHRDGALRLTLISRDGEGREQRTPVEIHTSRSPGNAEREAPRAPEAHVESLPERLRQDTSSALLGDALDLLDQLSDLAGEPAAATLRHTA